MALCPLRGLSTQIFPSQRLVTVVSTSIESRCTSLDNVDLDASLLPREGALERRAVSPRLVVNTEAISQNHVGVCPSPNDVCIPEAMGQQSNGSPTPNTAGPDIVPGQAVGPQLDVVSGGGSTGNVPHHIENPQRDGASNSNPAADRDSYQVVGSPSGDVSVSDAAGTEPTLFGGEASNANSDQVAPPPQIIPLSSSSPGALDISGRYTRSSQKHIFLLSTIVALIAFLIQYELVQEMSRRSTEIDKEIETRPGWAGYRDSGLKERQGTSN